MARPSSRPLRRPFLRRCAAAEPQDGGGEFSAWDCPHCYAFEPRLAAWVKQQGDNIVFKRVHVSGNASVAPQPRLFFTLEAMGLLEQVHDKVFNAMVDASHVDRWPLVAIGGRWLTSPSHAGAHAKEARTEAEQQDMALRVMDYLVAKARQ